MSGAPARPAGVFVVPLAAEHPVPVARVLLGGRDAIPPALWGQVAGGWHAERSEHASLEQRIEWLAHDVLDHLGEHDRAEIRVHLRLPGWRREGRGVHDPYGGGAGGGFPRQRAPKGEVPGG